MIGVVKVRLSSKRHIPIFCIEDSQILDREWYPFQLRSLVGTLLERRKWQFVENGLLQHKRLKLTLLPEHARLLLHEWPLWDKFYAPFSVEGKDVLDVGAGCGETAYFYFKKGAHKVICVEPYSPAVECLRLNSIRNSWNVEIVPEPFDREMLHDFRFDFVKMDGEGCEEELLQVDRLPTPAIVETHSTELTNAFVHRFHARVLASNAEISLLLVN